MACRDSYTLGSSPTTATQSFEYWKIDDTARSPYGALKRTKLTKDSTDLVNREMQYDPVGNVTKTVDSVNSETVDYTYDELDRLLTASAPSGESFVYNTIGNMTSKSGTTLDYGTTSPKPGVKTYGSASYTYDANGSIDRQRRPLDQVRPRAEAGAGPGRKYDLPCGLRRGRSPAEEAGREWHNPLPRPLRAHVGNGSDTTEVVTKYYYATLGAMMRLIAFRRGGTLHWAGTDHLGGTIRVMDSSFAAVDGMRYEPYGEDRDSGDSLNTDRKFTGQTEDETVGLYWYQSRAYDPEIGRFCSPDPIVPAPGNPQALNRYSYVYNNPLKYVDPSGHSPDWFNQKWRDDFEKEHGQKPTGSDIAYRYASMDAASRGETGFDQMWRSSRMWEKPWIQEFQESHARLVDSLTEGGEPNEWQLPESYWVTSDQLQGTNRSLGSTAVERHSKLMAEKFPHHKHTLLVVSKGAKFGGPTAGAIIDGVTTYVFERETGTGHWRALVVTVVDVTLVTAAGVGGTMAAGPVVGIGAGYAASVVVKELQPGERVADFLDNNFVDLD